MTTTRVVARPGGFEFPYRRGTTLRRYLLVFASSQKPLRRNRFEHCGSYQSLSLAVAIISTRPPRGANDGGRERPVPAGRARLSDKRVPPRGSIPNQKPLDFGNDSGTRLRRRASANQTLTVLKAALIGPGALVVWRPARHARFVFGQVIVAFTQVFESRFRQVVVHVVV